MGALRLTPQRALIAAGLVAAVLLLLFVAPAGALMLSPAIALIVLLGLGLFPSEELIGRLRRRLARPRRTPDLPDRRPHEPALGRAGAVLGFALAVRPPPRAATDPISA